MSGQPLVASAAMPCGVMRSVPGAGRGFQEVEW